MSFSIGQSFKLGWESWKLHAGLATGIYVTYLLISGLPDLFLLGMPESHPSIALLLSILRFLIGVFAFMGWVFVNLKMSGGLPVKWADFFSPVDFFPRFIGSFLLYLLMLFVGCFVMLIPIVWLGSQDGDLHRASPHHWGAAIVFLVGAFVFFSVVVMFCFWPYFMLDKDLSVMGAFQESKNATRGHRLKLFFLLLLSFLGNLLGALCLLVGLLFTIPLTALIWTHAYKLLSNEVAEKAEDS